MMFQEVCAAQQNPGWCPVGGPGSEQSPEVLRDGQAQWDSGMCQTPSLHQPLLLLCVPLMNKR